MGRTKENPRYSLLTFRVTEEEYREIYDEAIAHKISISEYLRKRVFK